jgi:hypothetical protein
LSLSNHALQHPLRVAAAVANLSSSPLPTSTVAADYRSSPRLASLICPWSWLRFPFSSSGCRFSPYDIFSSLHAASRVLSGCVVIPAQHCTVRARRRERRRAALPAHVPCATLCCPVLLGTALRGERAGQHRESAHGAARSCALMNQRPQPAPGAGSPTDDTHSVGTPR